MSQPGRLCKLYYNAGTYNSPTWTEIKRVSDVTIPMSKNTSTFVTRESGNQKTVIGSRVIQITGTYVAKVSTDSVLTAIKSSYWADDNNGAMMDLAVMDKAIATTGATGIRGMFAVTNFERSEPVEDAPSYSLTWDEIDAEESAVVVDVDEFTISGD